MTRAPVQTEDRIPRVESERKASKHPAMIPGSQQKRRISPFWRHYLHMAAVMAVGMFAAGAVLSIAVGLTSWGEVTSQYPTLSLVVMAAGMSIPMGAWMLFRGMGRRNSFEMAAAMVVPVIPFLILVWFGITKSAQCGAYCVVTFLAMYVLMRYRRDEYSTHV
jgi:hypothetical protein